MEMKAVIFDMDGVLTSTVGYHFESWKKVLGEHGIVVTSEDNDKLRGLTRRRSLEVLLKGNHYPEEQLREMLKRKNAYYLEFIQKMGPRDLSSGVSILLQELHLANVRIGVASASQNVRPVLEQLGVDGFMNALTDGTAVRRSKPAPDVFLKTAQALQVEPENCLAIEDSQAGIQAARTAGMVVVGTGPWERVGEAHAVFENLSQVHLGDLREIHRLWREGQHSPNEVGELKELA